MHEAAREAELCPRCGLRFEEVERGDPCPHCLLVEVLSGEDERTTSTTVEKPAVFGEYLLGRRLGEGGMGVVFAARHAATGRIVALKRIRDGELLDEPARQRFFEEAAIAATLDHPHVVPIYDIGEYGGQPFFTMKLLTGGTLDACRDRYRDPTEAARLIAILARALHEGHRKGIIHRDLKPENVLFDDRGKPHIADFGVAKYMGEDNGTATGVVIGTVCYMSPEQANGQAHRATVAMDVWSFGAILYEVLTGQRAFSGPTPVEVLRRTVEEEPTLPREVRPSIPGDLETILLTCLRKEPEGRYGSAEALADDLERFLRGDPVAARRLGRVERLLRFYGRNRSAALLLSAALLALFTLTLWAFLTATAQRRARRDEVLETNTYAAWALAGAVLAQIDEYAASVEIESRSTELLGAVQRGDRTALDAFCQAASARRGEPFVSWLIMGLDGRPLGHFPAAAASYYDLDLGFRDHFRRALSIPRGQRRETIVSRALRSSSDGGYKFALAAPVRGRSGETAAVLVATMVTDRRLGSLEMSDGRRIALLLGREDRQSAGDPLPGHFIVLAGPGVGRGERILLRSTALDRLSEKHTRNAEHGLDLLRIAPIGEVELDDEVHPPPEVDSQVAVSGKAPWLSAFARVGATELVVVVGTRLDRAVALDRSTWLVIAAWSLGGALFLGAGLLAVLRSSRRVA